MEPQTAEWIVYKAKRRADISMYFALAGLFIAPVLAPLIGIFLGRDSLRELREVERAGHSVDPAAIKHAHEAITGNLIVLVVIPLLVAIAYFIYYAATTI